MANPWEKYQQPDQPDGPWSQYQVPPPPPPPTPGPSSAGEEVTGLAGAVGRFATTAALPTAGSLIVPAAMTAALGPANLPFVPLERGLGSGMGEVVNQILGLTEPSLTQVGLLTVAPVVTEVGANLLRTGTALPKALNTQAPNLATTQVRSYRSAVPASQLFDQATKEGVQIPLTKTTTALQEMRTLLDDVTPAGKKAFDTVLKQTGLEDLATAPGGGITPSKMQNLLADIGKLQAQAAQEGGLKAKYLGKFFASLSDDLEHSGASLAAARKAFKREAVLDDLEGAISKALFVPKGQGLQEQFNANKIINVLNNTEDGLGKFFAQAFSRSEQADIKHLFGFLNELPSLKPGAGQSFGSGRFFERVSHAGAGGGIGAGVGFAVGGPAGAAVGAGAGLLAPETANVGRLVLQAWKMPGGRQVVKALLTNREGALTPQAVGALTSFVTAGLTNRARPPVQTGTRLQPFESVP